MKIHKKIGFGLVLITSLFAGLFFSHSSSAAPSFSAAWIDRSNIQVTGGGKTVVLTDGRWDAGWKYEGTLDGCSVSLVGGSLINDFADKLIVGFSDNSGHTNASAWNDSVSNAGYLRVIYKTNLTDSSCSPAFEASTVHIIDSANAQLAYRWTDSAHSSIARIDDGSNWTFSNPKEITSGFDSGKTRFFLDSETGKNCQDLIDVSPDGGTMWLYEQASKGGGGSSGKTSPADPNCNLKATIDDLTGGSATVDNEHYNIPSNYPLPLDEPFTPPGVTPPGDVTGTNAACYTWEWSWAVCPVITAAQITANAMYGFVEDQLKFTVLQNCTGSACTKDSLGKEHDSVHSAWSNFRILVSGLVVILLLVMVISQAIGTGPFDAYTVRKMLPRLVMGVILIQISWPLFSWVINTVDDLGRGLADLMYAPFGGSDALNLNSVMEPFTGKAILFSWAGIPALVIFGVVAPFVVIGLILTVLMAIFVGFLTLLFRKILIILALIFVPVALISWMMPNDGLRKYWKLWWDNFSKALMMFPLIIAIIAGGRIFAKIGSGGHDFVGFFIVLVGFFGPLFILPKTFKWGGTVMTMAGNAMTKAQTAASRKQKDFLTNPEKGVGGWWARRQGLHASEYTDADPFRKRLTNSLKAGRLIPTRRAKGAMIFRGNEFKSKEQELEKAIQERRREKQGSRKRNVMAGKNMDLRAVEEGARKAAEAKKLGLLGTQKRAERQAKEAMRDLIATGSTLELNNEEIMDSDGTKKFVWQTEMWRDLLNSNPELYRQVKGDAPDWVPHRTPTGLPKYRGELSDEEELEARKLNMTNDEYYQSKRGLTPEQHQLLKNNPDLQWASSLHETVTELDAGNLATLHPTYYERIGDKARQGQQFLDQAKELEESGGDTAEVARLEYTGKQLQAPAKEFGTFIKRLSQDSSGRQYLARAMGGADTMEHLDAALQFSGVEGAIVERPADAPPDQWKKGAGSMDTIYNMGRVEEAEMQRGGGGGGIEGPPGGGEVTVDLHPGERVNPGGVVLGPERRTRPPNFPEPGGDSTPPSPPPAAPTPPSPPPTAGGDTSAGPESQQGIPPEDFGPGGRFPPPNIPPGPGNV